MTYIKEKITQFNIWNLIFSCLFAAMTMVSRHIVLLDESERSTLANSFFSDMSAGDAVCFILIAAVVYLVMTLFPSVKKEWFVTKKRDKNIKVLVLIILAITVAWIPYLFSYWPGGVYSDTMNSLWIAVGQDTMSTHEPILYTLLWCAIFKITGGGIEPGEYIGLYTFTILQTITMIAVLSSYTYWCFRRGARKWIIIALTAIFAVFPLFPYYAVSLWKDTTFAIVVFLYSWQLLVMTLHVRETGSITKWDMIRYIIASVLTAFSRNNGMYVVIFVSAIAIILYMKKKEMLKKAALSSVAVIVGCLIIQHPVFNAMGINVDTIIESLGIPLQQTAYIISTDGKIKEEDRTFLDIIMPIESWKDNYGPSTADYIKFAPEFDRDFFVENSTEYLKVYTKLVLKNPVKAIKAYLLSTYGFWDIYKSSSVAYVGCDSIPWTGIYQGDFFDYYTGVSFRNLVTPRHYISAALWIWCMLLSCAVILKKQDRSMLLPVMPALGVWLTIMIAVPLAVSFRYVYAVFFCMPIYMACILTSKGEGKLEKRFD